MRRVPLGRIPSDQDVAGAIVYLASDLSSAMTGQALDTNGGEIFAYPVLSSPPLGVHERGSHGASGSTVGVGAWNAPELPLLPVFPVFPPAAVAAVVEVVPLAADPDACAGVEVAVGGAGGFTLKSVPVTTVTCEPGVTWRVLGHDHRARE